MKQTTTTTKNDYQPGNQLQRPKNNFGFLFKKKSHIPIQKKQP